MRQPTLDADKIGVINKIQNDFEFSFSQVISSDYLFEDFYLNLQKKLIKIKVVLKIWPQLFLTKKNSTEFIVDKKKKHIIFKRWTCKKQLKKSKYASHSFDYIFDHNENLVNIFSWLLIFYFVVSFIFSLILS